MTKPSDGGSPSGPALSAPGSNQARPIRNGTVPVPPARPVVSVSRNSARRTSQPASAGSSERSASMAGRRRARRRAARGRRGPPRASGCGSHQSGSPGRLLDMEGELAARGIGPGVGGAPRATMREMRSRRSSSDGRATPVEGDAAPRRRRVGRAGAAAASAGGASRGRRCPRRDRDRATPARRRAAQRRAAPPGAVRAARAST